MRCAVYGTVCPGEHIACAGAGHTEGPDALRGLQSSPGHCNSMYDLSLKGFAVAHGANQKPGGGNVWTALYNNGGSDIKDSESCIPPGWTNTGERIDLTETPTASPTPDQKPTTTNPESSSPTKSPTLS